MVGTPLLEWTAWGDSPTSEWIPQKGMSLKGRGGNRGQRRQVRLSWAGVWGNSGDGSYGACESSVVTYEGISRWGRPSVLCTAGAMCLPTCPSAAAASLGHGGKAPESGWAGTLGCESPALFWWAGITSVMSYFSVTRPGVKVRGRRPTSWWDRRQRILESLFILPLWAGVWQGPATGADSGFVMTAA